MFNDLELAKSDEQRPLDDVLDALVFNEEGLIPAIAQDATSNDVLMLAWMNRQSIERTLTEGYACYYSRSRQTYWRKGETSGHLQTLRELRFDCDGDAVLVIVDQKGAACHTNRPSCFYLLADGQHVRVTSNPG